MNFLWAQWCTMGVSGHAPPPGRFVIDPEALLAFSATLARHDARLFDEILDWLHTNGQWINVQRLQRILDTEDFKGRQVIAGMARFLGKGAARLKWTRLSKWDGETKKSESLFFGSDLKPLPVIRTPDPAFASVGLLRDSINLRGHSQRFPADKPPNVILRLRALMGLSARSEIITYLLTHDAGCPSEVARATYFFRRTVEDALADMNASWLLQSRLWGRERRYRLNHALWPAFVFGKSKTPAWCTWPPLFRALEMIWIALEQPKLAKMGSLLLASELRLLMDKIRPRLDAAGLTARLTDDTHVVGEAIIDVFTKNIETLLAFLEGSEGGSNG